MNRIAVRSTRLAPALLLVLAGAGAVPAGAQAPGAERKVTSIKRLGGPNACVRPPLKTGDDLQKMFRERRADLETILTQAGWEGNPEDVFRAVADGRFTEVDFPVGGDIPWMAMRRKRKLDVVRDARWEGARPFSAFEIKVESGDYDYTFLVPKDCGNLVMLAQAEAPTPTCTLTASTTRDCVGRPVTLDASRSTVASGRLRGVALSVRHPDGRSEDLGAPEAGGQRWTRTFRAPGSYTFTATATSERGRSATCTATVELTPCPPECAIALSATELFQGEEFTIDASGSKAQVGSLTGVEVEVLDANGVRVSQMELTSPYRTPTRLDRPGTYTLRAVATDDLDQRSTNACQATLTVLPRLGALADFFAGKERRIRPEFLNGRCAPLAGAKFGLTYAFSERFEIAGVWGSAFNTRDTDNWSMFADFELDWLGDAGFFGAGVGFWDFTHEDNRTGDLLVHGGINLPWMSGRRPVALFLEGRVPFDEIDDVENNYMVWAGLRFHFRN